ncbi:XRE family transcriptional regulator, partial [bacterium]|nr:XRE family transcriptional regulator [bacterium]
RPARHGRRARQPRGRGVGAVSGGEKGLTRDAIIRENVRRWRGYLMYTQEHITAAMNAHGHRWTRTTLSKIETGARQLTATEFVDLAIVLGVPMPWLLTLREAS